MKKNDVKKSLRLYISIKEYLENHLMSQKGASPQTIRSYRDSLNIYLEYLKSRNSCGLADLSFESMPLGEMHKFFCRQRASKTVKRNHLNVMVTEGRGPDTTIRCQVPGLLSHLPHCIPDHKAGLQPDLP